MVSAAALVELIGPWADGADPLNEQLAAALARAIDLGLLPPGTRLPAERELARELALSRTTIVAAYDRLRLAGLARSRQGSGTRVAARRPGLTQPYLASLDDDGLGRRPHAGDHDGRDGGRGRPADAARRRRHRTDDRGASGRIDRGRGDGCRGA